MKALRYLLLTTLLLTVPAAYAFDKVGTTAAQFLQIGVGARVPAMGGAGVAAVSGAKALYWNPARLVQKRRFDLEAYYSNWIADLRHQFIGLSIPVGSGFALGAFAVALGGDEFEQTTLSAQEGNGVMVGCGEMKLEGRDLLVSGQTGAASQYQVSGWPLPLSFQVGTAWKLLGNKQAFRTNNRHNLLVCFDGQHINEGLTRWRFGAEYGLHRTLYLRGGWVFGHDTETWSLGAGLASSLLSYRLEVNFAYADLKELNSVERISLRLSGR